MSGSARPHGGGLETRIAELERKGRDSSLEDRIAVLEAAAALSTGRIVSMGSVSLATGAASTVKTDAKVTASSLIFPVASNANGWSLDAGITGITPAAGSFTVSHSNSTLARSFNYIVINPV